MNSKSLEEILDKINSAEATDQEKVVEQPSPDAEGLVFEYHNDAEMKEEEPSEEAAPEVNETEPVESIPLAEVASESDQTTEDTVPEQSPSTRVWSTYVPRFTEVSEEYRMKGDKRFRARLEEMKGHDEKKETVTEDALDPTAEIEDDTDGVVTVHPERKELDEKISTLNIYKFSGEDDFVEEINGVTAEDEAKKIEELLAKEPAALPHVAPESVAEEIKEETVEEAPPEEPYEPELADPDDDEFRVIDYGRASEEPEDMPSGVEDPSTFARDGKGRIKASEYTNPVQRDGIKDRFLDSLMSIKIRFGTAVIFAIALLVLEILSAAGVVSFGMLRDSQVYFTLSLVDYLLAAGIFILSVPEIVRSVKYLITKKLLPDMLSLVGFIVLSLYTLAVVLTGVEEYPLFGFLFALMSLSSISASKYRMKADFLAFKVISQNEEKQILDKRPTRELSMENMALDGVIDEYSSRIVRTFRTSFVSDFFKNSGDVSNVPTSSLIVLAATLGMGLVAGLMTFFIANSLFMGVAVFTLSFMLGTPVFSILSNKLSFYQSQRAAVLEESAAVGEGAFYEFASTDVVAFDDTDIFGPEDVNLKRFMLYGDRDNMEKAMRQMCALFAVVGGPLDFMFTNAIDNRVRHKSATNTVIEDDGLSGDVMGHRISAGSQEYMIRNGIAIPEAARSTDVSLDTTKVLYAAEDGEVYAKFYIRYSFSEEFTSILPALKEQGIVPLVYTRDPNISNELLDTLTAGADCMRVVKTYKPIPAEEKVYGRVSARMVTFGDKLNTVGMVLLSKKYKSFSERMSFTEMCATGVGLILAIVLGILGVSAASVFVSIVWQIVWCIALHYMSTNAFLREARRKNEEE